MREVRTFALVCVVVSLLAAAAHAGEQQRPSERVIALARALDARLTVWKRPDGNVIHVSHCRRSKQGCRARLVTFARWIVEVSEEHGIDPFLLGAMAMRESGLDPFAAGAAGERGLVQLHPRGVGAGVRFVKSEAYRRYCSHKPGACQREVLEAGARLISKSIEHCGAVESGLGMYNSGACGENAYARRVLAEREKLLELASHRAEADGHRMVD